MRKHKHKHIPQLGVTYRPLTVSEFEITDPFIIDGPELYRHQKEYVYLMALFDSIAKDKFNLVIPCAKCGEQIKFTLMRNHIMIEDMENDIFGDDIKLKIKPRKADESIDQLIEFVVIDGEQIFWNDCKESEKEMVLESIDYAIYKAIDTALNAPMVSAHIPVRCSCGYEKIVSLRGLEAFLKVIK